MYVNNATVVDVGRAVFKENEAIERGGAVYLANVVAVSLSEVRGLESGCWGSVWDKKWGCRCMSDGILGIEGGVQK